MANIRVTPETLEAQGNDLKTLAAEISDLLAQIDSKVTEICDGWDGLAQDAYYDMYGTMKESLKQFPELVSSLGEATVAAAGVFGSSDEELRASFSGAK